MCMRRLIYSGVNWYILAKLLYCLYKPYAKLTSTESGFKNNLDDILVLETVWKLLCVNLNQSKNFGFRNKNHNFEISCSVHSNLGVRASQTLRDNFRGLIQLVGS